MQAITAVCLTCLRISHIHAKNSSWYWRTRVILNWHDTTQSTFFVICHVANLFFSTSQTYKVSLCRDRFLLHLSQSWGIQMFIWGSGAGFHFLSVLSRVIFLHKTFESSRKPCAPIELSGVSERSASVIHCSFEKADTEGERTRSRIPVPGRWGQSCLGFGWPGLSHASSVGAGVGVGSNRKNG